MRGEMTLFNSKYNCIISKLKTKSQAYIITVTRG